MNLKNAKYDFNYCLITSYLAIKQFSEKCKHFQDTFRKFLNGLCFVNERFELENLETEEQFTDTNLFVEFQLINCTLEVITNSSYNNLIKY